MLSLIPIPNFNHFHNLDPNNNSVIIINHKNQKKRKKRKNIGYFSDAYFSLRKHSIKNFKSKKYKK